MAGALAPAAVPGSATPYITAPDTLPAGMSSGNALSLLGAQAGANGTYAPTPQGPAAAAAPAVAPPPASDPSAAYNAQFVKSMAAARGAIAAQYAHQLAEVNAGVAGGVQMANAMPAVYNALGGAADAAGKEIAAGADKGAAATGIKSLGSAQGEADMVDHQGDLASSFEAGQAPLLAAGVKATGAIQSNALAAAQTQANAQLDEQQASFDHENALAAQQAAATKAAADLAWSRDPNNPESPSYKAALTLKGLNPDGTLTTTAQQNAEVQSAQAQLDKDKVTAFTGAQATTVRNGPTYKYIDSATKGDPKALTTVFNKQELANPGMKLAIQVWAYDHGINPNVISTLTGRTGGGPGSSGPSGLTNALGAAAAWENRPVVQTSFGGTRQNQY